MFDISIYVGAPTLALALSNPVEPWPFSESPYTDRNPAYIKLTSYV
tara:strand:+ start:294 stop:431 length:138 start_codon:yes stop_codon:yes gene_type:complete